MRQRLENAAGHDGQTRLGVVAVVEFAQLPLAETILQILCGVVQQGSSQLLRGIAAQTRCQSRRTVASSADGQRAIDARTVLRITCIAVNG